MLRAAISARGLDSLVAPDGETAAAQLKHQLENEKSTKTNYDPLMSAMFAISGNAADLVKSAGGNPLYIMVRGAEETPIEGIPGYEGRTWPYCPLCYINLVHEIYCQGAPCLLDKKRGYDNWIDCAADDQVEAAKKLGLLNG